MQPTLQSTNIFKIEVNVKIHLYYMTKQINKYIIITGITIKCILMYIYFQALELHK